MGGPCSAARRQHRGEHPALPGHGHACDAVDATVDAWDDVGIPEAGEHGWMVAEVADLAGGDEVVLLLEQRADVGWDGGRHGPLLEIAGEGEVPSTLRTGSDGRSGCDVGTASSR